MRKFLIIIAVILLYTISASAQEYIAPEPPESAQQYIVEEPESFADGLWYIVKAALKEFQPNLVKASNICLVLIGLSLLVSVMKNFSGASKHMIDLISAVCIATTLMQSADSLIRLGAKTVEEISEYGKLLLPVMTAALAAQGGTTTSAALYAGTAFFNTVLSSGITKLIIPLVYINIVLCIGYSAVGEEMLKNLRDLTKWFATWALKIVLYVFTGYLSVTGVVSGTTDAAALKAAKLTVSGVVPVVGNIISDASETILVSAGVIKNTVGVYGLLVVIAIWIGPFLQIGSQYLLIKLVSAICSAFGSKESAGLIKDFSSIMGILVAMTGTVCLLFFVSIICFLKGVG